MQQPIERAELAALTNAAWKESKLSAGTLWWEYRNRGGAVEIDAFKTWLRGKRVPDADQYDIMAGVLNDSLEGAGKEPMLPRLVLVAPRGGGALLTNDGSNGILYSRHWAPEQGFRDLQAVGE